MESEFLCDNCDYDLIKGAMIGRGACGSVNLAYIRNCGCAVIEGSKLIAVKQIHLEGTNAQDRERERESLRRRCGRLLSLRNSHVVRYYKLTLKEGPPRAEILMDYCAEGDLERYISAVDDGSQEKPSIDTVAEFSRQMARGIHYLHQEKIIHTDLKPANVLTRMTNSGDFKLLIADVDDCVLMAENVTGAMDITSGRGTFRYMSPEMILSHFLKVDTSIQCGRKTDIWSLGCIMIDLMDCHIGNAGIKRYINKHLNRETVLQLDNGIRRKDFRVMSLIAEGYQPSVPPLENLAGVVERCLSKIPDKRITAEVLLQELNNLGFSNHCTQAKP